MFLPFFTAPFSNTRTLKFKAQPDKCVFRCLQSNVWRLLQASDYCRALFLCLNCAQRFDYHVLDSGRKLGGVAEHLIDVSEKRICRLSFEVWSPHVIERRSNVKGTASHSTEAEYLKVNLPMLVLTCGR